MGTLFQDLAAQFNQAFIEADRWQRYLSGIGISFTVTLGALIIGIILGVLVAIIRTLHDQQKGTDHSVLLSVANKFCEFYTTVIRGTPMMVQLLIMGFVIFKSSRSIMIIGILSSFARFSYHLIMQLQILLQQRRKSGWGISCSGALLTLA